MKFGLYIVKSDGHWKIEGFNLGAFLLNFSLNKNTCWVAMIIFWNTCQTWERQTAVIELQLYQDATGSELA
jgi:hypothetical protein